MGWKNKIGCSGKWGGVELIGWDWCGGMRMVRWD